MSKRFISENADATINSVAAKRTTAGVHPFVQIMTVPGFRHVREAILQHQTLADLWAVRCVVPGVIIEKRIVRKVSPSNFKNPFPFINALITFCQNHCQRKRPALFDDLLRVVGERLNALPATLAAPNDNNDGIDGGWAGAKVRIIQRSFMWNGCPSAARAIVDSLHHSDASEADIRNARTILRRDVKWHLENSSYICFMTNCCHDCEPRGHLPLIWDMLSAGDDGVDVRAHLQKRLVHHVSLDQVYWWRSRIEPPLLRASLEELYGEALVRHCIPTVLALWNDMSGAERAAVVPEWAWENFFSGGAVVQDYETFAAGLHDAFIEHVVLQHGLPDGAVALNQLTTALIVSDDLTDNDLLENRAVFFRRVLSRFDGNNPVHVDELRFVALQALQTAEPEWTDQFFCWLRTARHEPVVAAALSPDWIAGLAAPDRAVWHQNARVVM